MLKRIQRILATIPVTGALVDFDYELNPDSVYIDIQGEAFQHTGYMDGSLFVVYAWQVPPVIVSVFSSSLSVAFSETPYHAAICSFQIIEYI